MPKKRLEEIKSSQKMIFKRKLSLKIWKLSAKLSMKYF